MNGDDLPAPMTEPVSVAALVERAGRIAREQATQPVACIGTLTEMAGALTILQSRNEQLEREREGKDELRTALTGTAEAAATHLNEVVRLKEENARLQGLLYTARARSKSRGLDLLREEANAMLPHFTPSWETLRAVAQRAGVKSAAWLAGRARDLQERNLIESKWIGAERTQFKLWRLRGRPVPVHASGQLPIEAICEHRVPISLCPQCDSVPVAAHTSEKDDQTYE